MNVGFALDIDFKVTSHPPPDRAAFWLEIQALFLRAKTNAGDIHFRGSLYCICHEQEN